MTKAEEIAIQELNARAYQYITEEEFNCVEHNCHEKTQLNNLDIPFIGNILSVTYRKYKYHQLTIHKQEITGEWITDSVVYLKQPFMSPEDIEEHIKELNTRIKSHAPNLPDFPMERKRPDNIELGEFL